MSTNLSQPFSQSVAELAPRIELPSNEITIGLGETVGAGLPLSLI
jgi:hypothetical protein